MCKEQHAIKIDQGIYYIGPCNTGKIYCSLIKMEKFTKKTSVQSDVVVPNDK
jgi:hypothetical protein